MKTEELIRYEVEYKAMKQALGTSLLVFEFPERMDSTHDRDAVQNKQIRQKVSGKGEI